MVCLENARLIRPGNSEAPNCGQYVKANPSWCRYYLFRQYPLLGPRAHIYKNKFPALSKP